MSETPKRIQLSRRKGWRMPPNTVKVDRTTRWGNPFTHTSDGFPLSRAQAVALFAQQLCKGVGYITEHCIRRERASIAYEVNTHAVIRQLLRGKNLACWCPLDEPCHADVLLQWANTAEDPP